MRSLLVALTACSYTPAAGSTPDAARDGGIDGTRDGSTAAPHLVLSEIFSETGDEEFVELFNPSSSAVPLEHVYLTDVSNYWKLPEGPPISLVSDFIARFPAGSEIAAGEVVVVAIDGPTFASRFARTPTYTVRTPTGGATAMTNVISLAGGTGAISDEGEMLVLFEWDGERDLVRDLDIVVHGTPTLINLLAAKEPVDGPDADSTTSAYAADSRPEMQMTKRTEDGGASSYQRVTLDEQELPGGNGATGHDETSEPLDDTWTATSTANPGSRSF